VAADPQTFVLNERLLSRSAATLAVVWGSYGLQITPGFEPALGLSIVIAFAQREHARHNG
jgi:hypothetical protein